MSFVNFNFVPNITSNSITTTGISTGTGISASTTSSITIFGFALLIIYAVTKILNFYGTGIDVYGSYLAFYVFLLVASFGLNRYYPPF